MNIPAAYHFKVDFIKSKNKFDTRFQEVSGISSEVNTRELQQGIHTIQLAQGIKYNNLVLKRGVAKGSQISKTFNAAMLNMQYRTQNVMVSLLDDKGSPRASWNFIDACPKKWSINDFNADSNNLVIETLEFYFTRLIVQKIFW